MECTYTRFSLLFNDCVFLCFFMFLCFFFSKFHPLYGYPLFRYELKIKSEIKAWRVGDFMDNSITWTLYIL